MGRAFSSDVPPALEQLGKLMELRYLGLVGNDESIGRLPEYFGNMRSLQFLHLHWVAAVSWIFPRLSGGCTSL
eukprot:1038028-Prymnesium_polylepis.1